MKEVECEPLIWVCEVIFLPRAQTLPKNAIKPIKQDTLKVKETLGHKVGRDISFCKLGSVLVFTSHTTGKTENLKRQVAGLSAGYGVEVCLATA